MKIYGPSIAEGSELTNLTVPVGTSFPSNANAGELFYRTDTNILHVHTGTAWNTAADASGIYVLNTSDTMTGALTLGSATYNDHLKISRSGKTWKATISGSDLYFLDNNNLQAVTMYEGGNFHVRSGNVGIGISPDVSHKLLIGGQLTGGANVFGSYVGASVQSDVTSSSRCFQTSAITAAASFTLPTLAHYHASQGTFGAGSTVTNQYGFYVENTLTGATNNYGFYSNIASGSNRYNLYMSGSANNYLAGKLGIGVSAPDSVLQVSAGTNNGLRVNYNSTGTNYLDATGSHIFRNGGTTRFTMDSNGVLTSSQTAGEVLVMDGGHSRINLHDGFYNFSIKAGASLSDQYVLTGSGAAKISMNYETSAGSIILQTAVTGTAGNAVPWKTFTFDSAGNLTVPTDITVGGISLDERIQDTVGAMVSGNNETGITVTYDDTGGKLDFAVAGTAAPVIGKVRGDIVWSPTHPSGYDVTRPATGQFNVTVPFTSTSQYDVIVGSWVQSGPSTRVANAHAVLYSHNATSFDVRVYDAATGTAVNAGFSFIVIAL